MAILSNCYQTNESRIQVNHECSQFGLLIKGWRIVYIKSPNPNPKGWSTWRSSVPLCQPWWRWWAGCPGRIPFQERTTRILFETDEVMRLMCDFQLHGNPGDYAWGRGGLDAIITQVQFWRTSVWNASKFGHNPEAKKTLLLQLWLQLLNHMDGTGPPPMAKENIADIPTVIDIVLSTHICSN